MKVLENSLGSFCRDGSPRILFIAFYFPPLHAIASVRAASIAKHLTREGWDVTIVTPNPKLWRMPDNVDRIENDFGKLRIKRIFTGHRYRWLSSGHLKGTTERGIRWAIGRIACHLARIMGIDEMLGWYPEVLRSCANIRIGDFHVVMATGGPFGSFSVARRLANRLHCPYVFDYRDLWTGNPHIRSIKKIFTHQYEQRLLHKCAAISVVSQSMASYLVGRFNLSCKVFVIPNGYDLDYISSIKPVEYGHFAIVYAGQFLPPKRTAAPLMRVIAQLMKSENIRPWMFHYYGPQGDHVRSMARKYEVEQRVVVHAVVSRRESLAAISGASLATIVISDNENGVLADLGILTGKIFEPIGLRIPFLAIAPNGSDIEELVKKVGNGAVFTASKAGEMAQFIIELMRGNKIQIGNPELYSWNNIVKELDLLLRSIIGWPNIRSAQ